MVTAHELQMEIARARERIARGWSTVELQERIIAEAEARLDRMSNDE